MDINRDRNRERGAHGLRYIASRLRHPTFPTNQRAERDPSPRPSPLPLPSPLTPLPSDGRGEPVGRGGIVTSLWCIVGITVAALANGCSNKSAGIDLPAKARTSAAVPVRVAKAEAEDVPIQLRNIGNVEAYATVTIRSQITRSEERRVGKECRSRWS